MKKVTIILPDKLVARFGTASWEGQEQKEAVTPELVAKIFRKKTDYHEDYYVPDDKEVIVVSVEDCHG